MGRVKQRDDKAKQKVNENPASSSEHTHGQTPRDKRAGPEGGWLD